MSWPASTCGWSALGAGAEATGVPPGTPPAYRILRTSAHTSCGSASSRVWRSSCPTGPIRPETVTENVVPGRATDRARRVRNRGTAHRTAALVDPRLADQDPTRLDLDQERQHCEDGEQDQQRDQGDEHLDHPLERQHRGPRAATVEVHDGDPVHQLARVSGARLHRREPGRYGVDVGGRGEQPLDGSGLLVAGRARQCDHDHVDVGLGHRPGQTGDRPEQGEGEPAGLVEGAGRAGADEADRPETQLGSGEQGLREPAGGRAGADDHRRPPEPPAATQHVGAAVDERVREHQAGEGEHAERQPGRAEADQDRGRGGSGHEQAGQVLDDREHQPGPVQVGGPGDQHGETCGHGQGRGRVVGRHQAGGHHGRGVRKGQHWPDRAEPPHPSAHACNHRPSPRTSCAGAPPFRRAAAAIQPPPVPVVHAPLPGRSPSGGGLRRDSARRARLRRAWPGVGGVRRGPAAAVPRGDRGVGAGRRRRADPRLLLAGGAGTPRRGARGAEARRSQTTRASTRHSDSSGGAATARCGC